jgi:cellulose synthase/poly-beta-1,6-N-acetylglucosamine synthase-like glycosyltransferase
MIADALKLLYLLTLAGLGLYGAMGLLTLWLYWRHRHAAFPPPPLATADLPSVTVQLPVYNERFVIARLIEAAVALDYPADRLQIQVLDDSTDDTTAQAAALVAHYRAQGFNITLLHRARRGGYKAGALAAALRQAEGEFLAIFDADFQPAPDFLRRTLPHFVHNPNLGAVQTRWGHLNADASPLTAAQAIALDKHFVMEQTVRHRARLFPKFNGAAGVWRRRCLEEVGGWQEDTVCEDLCLSTRAVLHGWEFRFLNEVVTPAELPTSILAYKNQQARWAKGSLQCVRKYGRAILTASHHSRLARLYALYSMTAYGSHFLLLCLLLLQIPMLLFDVTLTRHVMLFGILGVGQPLLFLLAQQAIYPDWRRRVRHLPTMLLIAIGLAPSNSRAMLQAFRDQPHPFVRTPKAGGSLLVAGDVAVLAPQVAATYRLPLDSLLLVEIGLAAYAGLGLALAVARRNLGPLSLLLTCFLGFSYVAYLSWRER